uniref:Uncharacterized protein n=1 Tax=Sipha flava TaxID=143950 RepID=A0A2S2PV85_9HEMI
MPPGRFQKKRSVQKDAPTPESVSLSTVFVVIVFHVSDTRNNRVALTCARREQQRQNVSGGGRKYAKSFKFCYVREFTGKMLFVYFTCRSRGKTLKSLNTLVR